MDASDRIPIRLYRPSTGTEGAAFQERFCVRCVKDRQNDCGILAASYAFSIDDVSYPRQWVEIGDEPQCTAFVEDTGQEWPAPPTRFELEAAGQQRLEI